MAMRWRYCSTIAREVVRCCSRAVRRSAMPASTTENGAAAAVRMAFGRAETCAASGPPAEVRAAAARPSRAERRIGEITLGGRRWWAGCAGTEPGSRTALNDAPDRGDGGAVRPDLVMVRSRHLDEMRLDRKSTRLNSSHGYISYAVFCLKK